MTPRVAIITSCTVNAAALLFALTPFFGVHRFGTNKECIYVDVYDYYYITYISGSSMLCIVLYGIIYGLIGRTAVKQKRKIMSETMTSSNQSKKQLSALTTHLKAVKNLMVVMVVFVVCVLPFGINNFRINRMEDVIEPRGDLSDAIEVVTLTLILLNSVSNPIIYAMKFTKFKKAFKNILFNINESIEA